MHADQTPPKPDSHRAVIALLGGPTVIARDLDLGRAVNTTIHWPARGIPAKHWHRVVELLTAKGVNLTASELQKLPVRTLASDRTRAGQPEAVAA